MKTYRSLVLVSSDPESLVAGSQELYVRLQNEINHFGLADEVAITMVSDIGCHDSVPMVIIYPETVVYAPVKADQAHLLAEEHLLKGRVVESLLAPVRELSGSIAWLRARKGTLPSEYRIVLERAGIIDPEDIEDYIIHDGYQALIKAVTTMTPEAVITEVDNSGLLGRGGAGFPTGRKWSFVRKAAGSPKYVICNADESEPGTFKDRLILEGDPHCIIEAMTIAGYAVGAAEGYIYIRGEYSLAYNRLKTAIQQAHEYGFLGKNLFEKGFNFEIHLHAGAGAYICEIGRAHV
jgi:NADP-reducing hydrogenase subunit HndC